VILDAVPGFIHRPKPTNVRWLSTYQCVQRSRARENHIRNPVLPVFEEDQVTRFYRRRDVGHAQVIAGHVVDANGYSDDAGIVPLDPAS
jgi:hypothetical protein